MDRQDQQAIEELFEKLGDVERRTGPRDREAEAFIRSRVAAQPGAPYYMAQTIVVQEQALRSAQEEIAELRQAGRPAQGGFLSGLFGGPSPQRRSPDRGALGGPAAQPWGRSRGMAGGGFLAGAAQTAMGVAGGVLLGNMIGGMFDGGEAQAAEPDADIGTDAGGGDFDFGGGDF